jgi:Raf kinase inhibitor-like YbhB/YbcL family protein
VGTDARAKGRAGGRVLATLVVLGATVSQVSGCGVLGSARTPGMAPPLSMTVTSPIVGADDLLPVQYTCHGAGHSPPLYWSGAPALATRSYAIVIDDSRAPITPYVYWIVFDIRSAATAIPASGHLPGAVVAMNSKGTSSYDPPCPRGGRNMYRITVYALNVARLRDGSGVLHGGASLLRTWSAIASHVIASGRLTVRAAA